MRAYWMRIALGALAIFVVGMIGVTLVRRGVSRVRAVAEGTGPINLPVAFVPFKLEGQKIGTISGIVLHRDAPKRLAAVELRVKLEDSLLAKGLEGCRLAAIFDSDRTPQGIDVSASPLSKGVFTCVQGHGPVPQFQEFGHATFTPGNVSVPLLLPDDVVNDLKEGEIDAEYEDSIQTAAEVTADSIAEEAEAKAESIAVAADLRVDSIMTRRRSLIDSLKAEGLRRADSARRAISRMSDSNPER